MIHRQREHKQLSSLKHDAAVGGDVPIAGETKDANVATGDEDGGTGATGFAAFCGGGADGVGELGGGVGGDCGVRGVRCRCLRMG